MNYLLTTAIGTVILSGCMSVSGLDAGSNFSCKAPDGVLCESMSGIYANAEQNNLPGQRVRHGTDSATTFEPDSFWPEQDSVVLTKPMNSGTPIRSAPRVLRVWFAPWEDTDGDLHDQGYVYLTVDSGQWLIEHNRRRIQDKYKPVHDPQKSQTMPSSTTDGISNVHPGSEQGATSIGAVQRRPTAQEAATMMGGIQTPDQISPQ